MHCKFNNRIISYFGEDGNNGKFGTLKDQVEKMQTELDKVKNWQVKFMIASAAGAGVGGTVVTAIARLFA